MMTEENKHKEHAVQGNLFEFSSSIRYDKAKYSFLDDGARDRLLVSLLSIQAIRGIGFKTVCTLFDENILTTIWELGEDELEKHIVSLPHKQRIDLVNAIHTSNKTLSVQGEKLAAELEKNQVIFIPIGHKSYPKTLLRLQTPPRWIFVKGNIDVLHSDSVVAVVGTRQASSEGLKLAYLCGSMLVQKNLIVLSGLAKGIDEKAHLGATEYYGQSIAILGHGIVSPETSYNQAVWRNILETDGAILSEYLPHDPPSRQGFLRRNELQAALSKVVIPVECPSLESGTGATIRRAISLKTPVVGVTYNDHGTNALASTNVNLTKLGIRVFSLQAPEEFWLYLRELIPDHDWNGSPADRQNRLFRKLERVILPTASNVNLDNNAIDRLAEHLKKRIAEGGIPKQDKTP